MRIGIVGGGQLGRMLALAAYPLGLSVTALDGSEDAPAGAVCPLITGDYGDRDALARIAAAADVVTFDFENVPADAAEWLSARVPVLPAPHALRVAQDRVDEKSLFGRIGIPTTKYAAVDDARALDAAIDTVGLPLVLKTRRLGYDGKGQRVAHTRAEAADALVALGGRGLIAEAFVAFAREVSVVAVRDAGGTTACYPLTENLHHEGILRTSVAPSPASRYAPQAQQYAERLLDELAYVGVLALELFECDDGLVANEFAPRVHNSGHWTIEGAHTSQFENHLRAIAGLPLGTTAARGCAAMVNFIGGMPDRAAVLAIRGAHLHDYGKAPRPGRKLGHATVVADSHAALSAPMAQLAAIAEAACR